MQSTRAAPSSALRQGPDFERFFADEYSPLFQVLVLVTGDRVEAEDLAQEAMARAYERWPRVRHADSPAAYVYRTAFNLNRKRLRRLAVRVRKAGLFSRPEADPSQDPAGITETRSRVRRALAALPVAQREAVVLVEWLGMDAEEAGRVLGIEAVSVRGRLHRARTTLRERFGGNDD